MRLAHLAPLLALLLGAAAPAAAAPPPRPRLAVLDFTANGASRELASAAAGQTATELDRLGAFQVITAEAIRSMLAFERQRQMLGCTEAGCLAELGGVLGADLLLSGKVSRLAAAGGMPETFTLELTLSSVKRGEREGSAIESARSEAELVTRIPRAVPRLVQKVLAGRTGRLLVAASEGGALVKVDDQARGTTPLRGPLVLPAGPHTLLVEKQGFVAHQEDVLVEAGRLGEARVTLVPSLDFVRSYEARQRKLRLGAWLSTGLAAAGLAGAALLQADADRLYGNESSPGTFLYVRGRLAAGVETEDGVSLRDQASSLRSRISSRETLSYVSAGVGGLAAATAAFLWIRGDDPDRYAAFREQAARLDVVPTQGGAFAAVTVGF